jgi:prepilin signal peptidase PulO-like enzyme (type II secretory pathway)
MLTAVLMFTLGSALGSFLLTAVDRSHRGQQWKSGRSNCESCRRQLSAWELIPILSFFLLLGRCRTCKARIAWRHLASEIALGLLFLAAYVFEPQLGPELLVSRLALLFVLFALFLSDATYGTLPDTLTIPALLLFGFEAALRLDWLTVVFGAIVGGGFFALQYLISRGKWIGSGDIRLGALIGAVLGWPLILAVLLLSYVGGAVVVLVLLSLKRKKLTDKIAFGTFLIPASVLVMWFGKSLVTLLPF